jgi:hypothetical protein
MTGSLKPYPKYFTIAVKISMYNILSVQSSWITGIGVKVENSSATCSTPLFYFMDFSPYIDIVVRVPI